MGMHELDVQMERLRILCPEIAVCRMPFQAPRRSCCEYCEA